MLFSGCKDKSQSESKSLVTDSPLKNLKTDVAFWLTSPESKTYFQQQDMSLLFTSASSQNPVIEVDTVKTFQTMDGFGNCLTGGSATHIHKMDAVSRAALLKELFSTDGRSIGLSYLRVSIGASDLDESVFSYNDLPAGETDLEMTRFDLGHDKLHLIPVLKEILAINPDIKILGSPWSAPVWMKTNNDTKGGSLKPEYFDAYAKYFVKYILAMKSEGIRIDAITIQNEPLHPGNNPSMYMTAGDQTLFIKKSLGPAFVSAGIDTKIIIYDHNADRPDYPLTILNDPEAAKYVDGSAFHLYGGTIDVLSQVHIAFPDKNLYFTEQWVAAPGNLTEDLVWHVGTLIIGGTRNWCRNVLEWNMAADQNNDPHTDRGGCDMCLGTITIDGDKITRNPAYYILAHASKFVRPGSVRVDSNLPANLPNVSFKTPSGQIVLIVLNDATILQKFDIRFNGKSVSTALEKGAVCTYVW
jgi:glucosylceramidase